MLCPCHRPLHPSAVTAPPRINCLHACGGSRAQIRGIEGMVENDRYCIDVLTQISAAQAALDKVALGLLDDHAHHRVIGPADPGEREEKTAELMAAVGRLLRRG